MEDRKLQKKQAIQMGKTALGIEFGSTRIKAVLVGEDYEVLAIGNYEWENRYSNGIWTYSMGEIIKGLQESYTKMALDVKQKYHITITTIGAIGFSGMMHGYMVFDEQGELLVPFRTWRNVFTGEAAKKLSELFGFHIPERWSIAHLYHAILKQEEHIKDIHFLTTLSGFIHWKLTGEKVLGIGEASGVFPIDFKTKTYDQNMINIFQEQVEERGLSWKLDMILPKVLVAGQQAGVLTKEGAKLLDSSGNLQAGIPLCPPEGDAGTGMVATNSVSKRTGNVSAGTSVFAMIVLEKPLKKMYEEIDIVTTPSGDSVAMVHANNCTSDINAWVQLFKEFADNIGSPLCMDEIYKILYTKALEGDNDCGGLLAYGYLSGENITKMKEGRPLFVRSLNSKFNLANFMRTHLFTSLGALKIGLDILKEESVQIDKMLGHGGLFKTKQVGQRVMAAAIETPVTVMKTAGEGGAWGMAILALYQIQKEEGESLTQYLTKRVFYNQEGCCMKPLKEDIDGFCAFMKRYQECLSIEQEAVKMLK